MSAFYLESKDRTGTVREITLIQCMVGETVNWFAVIGVLLGAVVANLVPWGIASINGMIVAAVCYLVGSKAKK